MEPDNYPSIAHMNTWGPDWPNVEFLNPALGEPYAVVTTTTEPAIAAVSESETTVDGLTLTELGSHVLLTNQPDPSENGTRLVDDTLHFPVRRDELIAAFRTYQGFYGQNPTHILMSSDVFDNIYRFTSIVGDAAYATQVMNYNRTLMGVSVITLPVSTFMFYCDNHHCSHVVTCQRSESGEILVFFNGQPLVPSVQPERQLQNPRCVFCGVPAASNTEQLIYRELPTSLSTYICTQCLDRELQAIRAEREGQQTDNCNNTSAQTLRRLSPRSRHLREK